MSHILNNLIHINQGLLTAPNDLDILKNLISQYEQIRQLEHFVKQQIVGHPSYPQYIQSLNKANYGCDFDENMSQTHEIQQFSFEEKFTASYKNEEAYSGELPSCFEKKETSSTDCSPKNENDETILPYKIKEEKDVVLLEYNKAKEEFPKVRRRNGFENEFKKDNKKYKEKNELTRSKAKHLWISYGRQIAIYAAKHTEGKIRERIQECEAKLKSKKAFFEVFKIMKNDSDEDKLFKLTFGRLALEFLRGHVEEAFTSSNYRDDLLAQKNKVAKWILSHISILNINEKHEPSSFIGRPWPERYERIR